MGNHLHPRRASWSYCWALAAMFRFQEGNHFALGRLFQCDNPKVQSFPFEVIFDNSCSLWYRSALAVNMECIWFDDAYLRDFFRGEGIQRMCHKRHYDCDSVELRNIEGFLVKSQSSVWKNLNNSDKVKREKKEDSEVQIIHSVGGETETEILLL